MQYLFITHQFMMGGVEKVFLNIATNLPDRKIFLLPTCQNYDQNLLAQLPQNVSLIENNRFRIDGIASLGNLFLLAHHVNRLFAGKNDELCCVNFSDTFSTFLLSLLIKAERHICWCHSNPENIYVETRFFFFYKKLFKKFQTIVCLCEGQMAELCRIFGKNYEYKTKICYNFTDLTNIDNLKEKKIDYGKEYLLMVSRFDSRSKDFYTLVNAYKSLDQSIKNKYSLVLVGDGPDKLKIQQYVEKLGEQHNIHFAGLQANPYKWMNRASVFVLSSRWEGFGLVITEALACGCAVISSDCIAGPKDILCNGKYGLLFDVGNEKALKECLEKMLTDDELRHKFQQNARKRVEQINEQSVKALNSIIH